MINLIVRFNPFTRYYEVRSFDIKILHRFNKECDALRYKEKLNYKNQLVKVPE